MSQPNKRQRFLQSSEIAELFLDTDSGDASDASSVEEGPKGVSGVSHIAKQPVVLSPAVQFRPVPLMKMKLLRVCQVNRLNRQ